jgi:hypothetical protein
MALGGHSRQQHARRKPFLRMKQPHKPIPLAFSAFLDEQNHDARLASILFHWNPSL